MINDPLCHSSLFLVVLNYRGMLNCDSISPTLYIFCKFHLINYLILLSILGHWTFVTSTLSLYILPLSAINFWLNFQDTFPYYRIFSLFTVIILILLPPCYPSSVHGGRFTLNTFKRAKLFLIFKVLVVFTIVLYLTLFKALLIGQNVPLL